MKIIVFLLSLLFCSTSNADNVFRQGEAKLSFRYPDNWSERKPQMHTTLVLLYADDGSDATCNVTAKYIDKLLGLSEAQLEKLRLGNHKKDYFEKQFTSAFPNLSLKKYWRGMLGQKEAGFAEMEHDIYVNDKKLRLTQFVGSTFANERRFTLICNGPPHGVESARAAFSYIRNTMMFMY